MTESSVNCLGTHVHTHTRRIEEASPGLSDAQAEVLEQITRKASIKKAKEMADATQREYILAETKARAQEDTVRKIHQKQADKAMEASLVLNSHMLILLMW